MSIWKDICKLPEEEFRKYMCADYDDIMEYYPHTELRFLDSTKKYKILDFGCGDGRNAAYLRQFASRLDGFDLEEIIPRAEGYDNLYSDLSKIGEYDIIICAFTIQFFTDVKYLQDVISKLSGCAPYIYFVSRIYMEDENHSNIFPLLFEHPDITLELGDGQNLGWLKGLTYPSEAHFEQVYKSKKILSKITPHIGFDIHQQGQWIYKSYADAAADLREFAKKLPPLSGVCGVPRSGIALAGMLSHIVNTKYYSIESLRSIKYLPDETVSFRPNNCRPITANSGPILVLDDTCWSGYAIANTKKYLCDLPDYYDIIYGALYVSNHAAFSNFVDYYHKIFPTVNHTFEWNILRDPLSQKYIVDLDGVLCEDWLGPEHLEDTKVYLEHLSNAKPLYKPNYPIYKIVTARLEKYRDETENWLKKNGVVYGELVMSPYSSKEERFVNDGFIGHKVKNYLADNFAVCFVESSVSQAEEIFAITHKPVFCIDNMRAYGNLKI